MFLLYYNVHVYIYGFIRSAWAFMLISFANNVSEYNCDIIKNR